ncbi:MAG: cobalamin-dependent protein, partial [Candidatus Aminicenantes bacterium]
MTNNTTISFNSITPKYSGDFSLAFLILKSYILSRSQDFNIIINKFFCEDPGDIITSKIISQNVDIIAFSAYIWNFEIITKVAKIIKEKKDAFIIIGGPDVTFNSKEVIEENPFVDLVVQGEGEE